mgnify:CR=1 FL=1
MVDDGAAMYIFYSAGFEVFNQEGNNPSTEIIVRHSSEDAAELMAKAGVGEFVSIIALAERTDRLEVHHLRGLGFGDDLVVVFHLAKFDEFQIVR